MHLADHFTTRLAVAPRGQTPTASQGGPACYTAQLNNYASPWNRSLWYGGPGGNC
jgi:hypothetical protein